VGLAKLLSNAFLTSFNAANSLVKLDGSGNLPAVGGAAVTGLNASNLASGTVPDARFPATLPAASAANLTSIPAANLTGALPAISGASLTGIATGDTYVFRSSDSAAVNNSTTFVDDGVLEFAVAANKIYVGRFVVWVTSDAAVDYKFQLTGPASPTQVRYCAYLMAGSSPVTMSGVKSDFSQAANTTSGGTDNLVVCEFSINNGANAGTVKWQFAQNAIGVVDTKNLKGSFVSYKLLN